MVSSTKILTVSYGTFSCTAEGFEDPLSAVKQTTNFMRGVVREDRFFGSEPPRLDADAALEMERAQISFDEAEDGLTLRPAVAGAASAGALTAALAAGPARAKQAPVMDSDMDRDMGSDPAQADADPADSLPDDDSIDAAAAEAEAEAAAQAASDPVVASDMTTPETAPEMPETQGTVAAEATADAPLVLTNPVEDLADTLAAPTAELASEAETARDALDDDGWTIEPASLITPDAKDDSAAPGDLDGLLAAAAPEAETEKPSRLTEVGGLAAKLARIRDVVSGGTRAADTPQPEALQPEAPALEEPEADKLQDVLGALDNAAAPEPEDDGDDRLARNLAGLFDSTDPAEGATPDAASDILPDHAPEAPGPTQDAAEDPSEDWSEDWAETEEDDTDQIAAALDDALSEMPQDSWDSDEDRPDDLGDELGAALDKALADESDLEADPHTELLDDGTLAETTEDLTDSAAEALADAPDAMPEADALVSDADAEAEDGWDEFNWDDDDSDAPATVASADPEPEPEAAPEPASALPDLGADLPPPLTPRPRPRARVIKVKKAVFDKAVSSGAIEEVAEDTPPPERVTEQTPPPVPLAERSSLSPDDEDDLARQLAEVSGLTDPAQTPEHTQEPAAQKLADTMAGWDDEDMYEDEDLEDLEADTLASVTAARNASEPLRLDNPVGGPVEPSREWDTDLDALDARAAQAEAALRGDADEFEFDEETVRKTVKMASAGRAMLTEKSVADNDASRILDQTNEELEEPEGNRRRSAIAHLRAAVAATRADRLLGRKPADPEEEFEPYREDLANVVRPRRPRAAPATSDRPTQQAAPARPATDRPAPLKLVAEQRVPEDPATVAPVRPRRVARPVDPAPQAASGHSFADYAAGVGAHDLPELLEAAAAYMSFVEGRDQFSRPQLMTTVRQAEASESSREDRLRSFGQLLRDGKIEKTSGGRFTASDRINFKPKRAAG